MNKKIAIIAGAGVAGLTAAKELLDTTDIHPIIFEMTDEIGGISKTVNFKGNRMDIGGHRFFSKSDRVMSWWENILPVASSKEDDCDQVMFLRIRISRIFYMKKFFDYPIKLNYRTIRNLGLFKMIKLGISYFISMVMPIKNEQSLEDFFINRFGKELYKTFFKDYTEKVWGVPCTEIKPEWGAQRIKGISIKEVIKHALKSAFISENAKGDVKQKNVETSLIGQFMYPKFGVGQMWDEVARDVLSKGCEIRFYKKIIGTVLENKTVKKIIVEDQLTDEYEELNCDYFFSTMAVKDLVEGINGEIPKEVFELAGDLKYRDFISVGLLLNRFNLGNDQKKSEPYDIPDNWIYIQENSVKMGRIQIFNNWSPYMVNNSNHIWVGTEYFCNEGDEFWEKHNEELIDIAIEELIEMEAISKDDFIDGTVVRMKKAYPSYIGSYDKFDVIKDYLNSIENLFLIGRNGMHRYNNMDHSMLTAMMAVENIKNHRNDKSNIWNINIEDDYHEEKKEA